VARRSVYIIFGIVYARKKKIKMFSSEKTGSPRSICTVRFFFFYFFYTSFAIPPTFLPRGLVSRGGGNNSAHGPLQSHQRQQTLYVSWLGMKKKKKYRIFVDKTPLLLFQLSCAHQLADHNAFHISGNGF